MAANKPSKGKAPAVEFSSAPEEKKTRGPRTGNKNQPMAAPIMDSSDENASKLLQAKREAQEKAKLENVDSSKWEPLNPEESDVAPTTSASAAMRFNPTDLARRLGVLNKNLLNNEKAVPKPGRTAAAAARRTDKETYGPAGVVQSQGVSFEPRQVASSLALGVDEEGKPFVNRMESGKPITDGLSAVPGERKTEPYFTPQQINNRSQLEKQQALTRRPGSGMDLLDQLVPRGDSTTTNSNLKSILVAGKRTLVDTSRSDDEVSRVLDNKLSTPLSFEEHRRLYPASTNGDPHLIYADFRNAKPPSRMERTLLGSVSGRGLDRTRTYSDSNDPKERYQQYLAVKKSMYIPPVEPGNKGMYTPPNLTIPHEITSSGHRVLLANNSARTTGASIAAPPSQLPGEVKVNLNATRPEANIGQDVLNRAGAAQALPHRHEVEHNEITGEVRVVPIKQSFNGTQFPMHDEAKTFGPNQDVSADSFRPVPGKYHYIAGESVQAHTKATQTWKRTNNNGKFGVVKGSSVDSIGTFYKHPETGQIVQTFDKPTDWRPSEKAVAQAKEYYENHKEIMGGDNVEMPVLPRSVLAAHEAATNSPGYNTAIEKHHVELFKKYNFKGFNGESRPEKELAASNYANENPEESKKWVADNLHKAISDSGEDHLATMGELEKHPDQIHDIFNDHFVVKPQRERDYKNAVKRGLVPKRVVPPAIRPDATGNVVPPAPHEEFMVRQAAQGTPISRYDALNLGASEGR